MLLSIIDIYFEIEYLWISGISYGRLPGGGRRAYHKSEILDYLIQVEKALMTKLKYWIIHM